MNVGVQLSQKSTDSNTTRICLLAAKIHENCILAPVSLSPTLYIHSEAVMGKENNLLQFKLKTITLNFYHKVCSFMIENGSGFLFLFCFALRPNSRQAVSLPQRG